VSGSTLVAAQREMRLTILSRSRRTDAPARYRRDRTRAKPAIRRRTRLARNRRRMHRRAGSLRYLATELRLMIETTFRATSEKL